MRHLEEDLVAQRHNVKKVTRKTTAVMCVGPFGLSEWRDILHRQKSFANLATDEAPGEEIPEIVVQLHRWQPVLSSSLS
jgi:hypothetical protein